VGESRLSAAWPGVAETTCVDCGVAVRIYVPEDGEDARARCGRCGRTPLATLLPPRVPRHPSLRRYTFVTAPDGRQFRGRRPGELGVHGEAPYIAALAEQVGGIAEVVLPAGRADVATNTHVYEVEPARSWRRGAQQAYAYGAMSGLAPVLALFGEADYLDIYVKVRDRMPGLALWRWNGGRWEGPVSNRKDAARRLVATEVPRGG